MQPNTDAYIISPLYNLYFVWTTVLGHISTMRQQSSFDWHSAGICSVVSWLHYDDSFLFSSMFRHWRHLTTVLFFFFCRHGYTIESKGWNHFSVSCVTIWPGGQNNSFLRGKHIIFFWRGQQEPLNFTFARQDRAYCKDKQKIMHVNQKEFVVWCGPSSIIIIMSNRSKREGPVLVLKGYCMAQKGSVK